MLEKKKITTLNVDGVEYQLEIPNTYATKSFVEEKVASIVDSAPETLDTLNELAEALGNDKNFSTTISNQLGNKLNKIDVINIISSIEAENPTDKPISAHKAYELQHHIDTANANRAILKDRVDKLYDENTIYDFKYEDGKLKITSSNLPQSFTINCDVNPEDTYNSNFAIYTTANTVIYDGSWKISNGWKYYLIVDNQGRIQYASYHPVYVGIMNYASHSLYKNYNSNPVFKTINNVISLIIPEGSFLILCNKGDSENSKHSEYGQNINNFVNYITNGNITTLDDNTRNSINTQGAINDNIRILSNITNETIKCFKETDLEIELGGSGTGSSNSIDLGELTQDPVSNENTVLDNITTSGVYHFTYRYSDSAKQKSYYRSYIMMVYTQDTSSADEKKVIQIIFQNDGTLKTFQRYQTGLGNWGYILPKEIAADKANKTDLLNLQDRVNILESQSGGSTSSGSLYRHTVKIKCHVDAQTQSGVAALILCFNYIDNKSSEFAVKTNEFERLEVSDVISKIPNFTHCYVEVQTYTYTYFMSGTLFKNGSNLYVSGIIGSDTDETPRYREYKIEYFNRYSEQEIDTVTKL